MSETREALAIVQAARRGASDSNRHSRASPGGKGKSRQPFGRQRVPNSARHQRQSDDRPPPVVGRIQRPRPESQQRRGTDLQAKLDKRKARSICHACGQTGHWAGDPQCPGRPVNVIELEDEVQEFEPNQDAGTRQILSAQVDVSDVRFLRPSTRLVLAVISMDVGRREGARGVIVTAARYTHAGRAWDRACRRICAERSIGHLINVTPESEVYRFGNGCLSGRRQESPDSFLRIFSLVGVSHLVFLNVSGSTWEVSLNHPSVNCLSKLDVDFCQRRQCRRPRMLHVSVPEERGSTADDVWWTNFRSSGTILRQNCGFVQF